MKGKLAKLHFYGNYGPYIQSERKQIYESYAKYLVQNDLAYPCFCSEEDLTIIRNKQEEQKIRPGYYGVWTKCRDLCFDEIKNKINNGEKYVLRLKSKGIESRKTRISDIIKGKLEFPENDQDIVILKSDGIPTYHFAHAVDDHLMRTTHVIRGDEWMSSLPIHIQLFEYLNFEIPRYAHIAPIMKEEDGAKRKLSKRKDPEASVSFYHEQGIPKEAVIEYLLNIANSNYEQWRKQNPTLSFDLFKLELNKMSPSGALFDMVKLLDISKTVISRLSCEQIYDMTLEWASIYDKELKELLVNNSEYSKSIFNIERGNVKPRKDISKWKDVKDSIIYMFDENFNPSYEFQNIKDINEIKSILNAYLNIYDINDAKEIWFNKIKDLGESLGYARETKIYKEAPDKFKGHVGDISTVLRIALTGRSNTPDMYEIMHLLGTNRIKTRFESCKKAIDVR